MKFRDKGVLEMIDPREEFKDIMRELAQEETRNILQNEDIYQNVMGTIISENENDTYTVDLVSTTLHNIINQTGVMISPVNGVTSPHNGFII